LLGIGHRLYYRPGWEEEEKEIIFQFPKKERQNPQLTEGKFPADKAGAQPD